MVYLHHSNMMESYSDFFRRISGNPALPYQEAYGKNPFSSTLLVIPTGLGKTDAVLLPWLYSVSCANPLPTRLIIVLPRQNLTVQTASRARKHVIKAKLENEVRVLELLADSKDNDERLRPDQKAIIVCTQDLYFSRALNRGYARRPTRWPIDFALYNQDCVIVLDEIQLMDDALATSTQLAAFRSKFEIFGEAPCVWMSATVNDAWLQTVDSPDIPPRLELTQADLENDVVLKRLHAPKSVAPAPEECRNPAGCAEFLLAQHRPNTRSLVITNTVPRAREIFRAIRAKFPSAVLLHSRFRPADRKREAEKLAEAIPTEGQIVVATQVLEAGVDITAQRMVTDIAPWGSLVQRFGRVNRYGEDVAAQIWWVDKPQHAKQKDPDGTAPYLPEQIERARVRMAGLQSGAPADLTAEDGPEPWQHVLRRNDLLDLFDTTPDLSGNEIDVSRFIRASEDKDAYLAWRTWEGQAAPPEDLDDLADEELCPVPIGELREFGPKHPVYSWNFATDEWVRAERFHPGMLLVTRCKEGGYTGIEGWSPESKSTVEEIPRPHDPVDGDSGDRRSFQSYRQTLVDHTRRVVEELEVLLRNENLPEHMASALRTAGFKHDWGKAHPIFQATLHRNDPSPDILAKQNGHGSHSRKHFRHELASALAMIQSGDADLASYLVASHHGKVRMNIRSMPFERQVLDIPIARGIQEGDRLPACDLANDVSVPEVELALSLMQFGADGGSWTDRALRLLEDLGPFRLAYLEMLLRVADEEASNKPNPEVGGCA